MESEKPTLVIDTDDRFAIGKDGSIQFSPELEQKIAEFADEHGMEVNVVKQKIVEVSSNFAALSAKRYEELHGKLQPTFIPAYPSTRYRPKPIRPAFPLLTTADDRRQSLASRKRALARKRK